MVSSSRKNMSELAAEICNAGYLQKKANIMIRNTGAETVFIGPSSVTAANGFSVLSGEVIGFEVQSGESVYGVCAAGKTTTLEVISFQAG